MKIKVADLYDLSIGLGDLTDKELPTIATSLKVQQNLQKVSEELIPSDKLRQKIFNKYKDEKGGIKKDKREVYRKETEELLDQDIELDVQKIKLKDLGDISIKPRTLIFLEKILIHDSAK